MRKSLHARTPRRHCDDVDEDVIREVVACMGSAKRIKLNATDIGQAAFSSILLPALPGASRLVDLQLSGCGLTAAPPELFHLPTLRSLDLSFNKLASGLPSAFWSATELRRLELHTVAPLTRNRVNTSPNADVPTPAAGSTRLPQFPPPLPPHLAQPPAMALAHVNISGCGVGTLHPSISALSSLRMLYATHNALKELPEVLAQMRSLIVLDVQACPLARVPPALAGRRNLDLTTGLPNALAPWLQLGDLQAASNAAGLTALGVQRIISVVQPPLAAVHPGMDTLCVSVDDTPVAGLGFADVPVPYLVRFTAAPANRPLTPASIGLAQGVDPDTPLPPPSYPPHLARLDMATPTTSRHGTPPLQLHAARYRVSPPVPPSTAPLPPEGPLEPSDLSLAPVLVHCQAGASRSAAVSIALLMALLRWPLARAFRHVKGRRGVVQPNLGFCQQLLHFERTLVSVGVLTGREVEFGPPRSPRDTAAAGVSGGIPNSTTVQDLVQQASGTLSASVWEARYGKAPPTEKRGGGAAGRRRRAQLRSLVKVLGVAARLRHGRESAVEGDVEDAGALVPPPTATVDADSTLPLLALPAEDADGHDDAVDETPAHHSWCVETSWVSPPSPSQHAAQPGPRPIDLERKPSLTVSDWGGDGDARACCEGGVGVDDAAAAARRRRRRWAPTAHPRAPPAFSGLPPSAWSHALRVEPSLRQLTPTLVQQGGGDTTPSSPLPPTLPGPVEGVPPSEFLVGSGGTIPPFTGQAGDPAQELCAPSTAAGTASGVPPTSPSSAPAAPIVAVASAVSLAQLCSALGSGVDSGPPEHLALPHPSATPTPPTAATWRHRSRTDSPAPMQLPALHFTPPPLPHANTAPRVIAGHGASPAPPPIDAELSSPALTAPPLRRHSFGV